MNLDNLINNLTKFDFKAEQETIVAENKDKLSDLLAVQFAHGLDAQNKPIELINNPQYGYGYRPFTIQQKSLYGKGLGAITDHITFYMTGNLYKRLETRIQGSAFETYSTVPYWSVIVQRTQTDSVKLSEDSRREFAEGTVLPGIDKALKEKVFG